MYRYFSLLMLASSTYGIEEAPSPMITQSAKIYPHVHDRLTYTAVPSVHQASIAPIFSPSSLRPSLQIKRIGRATVAFNDETVTEEIKIAYNISLSDSSIRVYEQDCHTPVPWDTVKVSKTLSPTSLLYGILNVDLDIVQGNVTGSSIWTDSKPGVACINLCVRTELSSNNTSVSETFDETKFALTLHFAQNFKVSLKEDRIVPSNIGHTTDVKYKVHACHCDFALKCINNEALLHQGLDFLLCIRTSSATNVHCSDIYSLKLRQGLKVWSYISSPVDESEPLSAVYSQAGTCVVRTQLHSTFFEQLYPANITVSGVALLNFSDVNNNRYLRSEISGRDQHEGSGKTVASSFQLDLGVGNAVKSAANSKAAWLTTLVVGGGCFFSATSYCLTSYLLRGCRSAAKVPHNNASL